MNVFYIPGLGYIFNGEIWLRFEKLVETLYNKSEILVVICNDSDPLDRSIKSAWHFLVKNGVKYEDA